MIGKILGNRYEIIEKIGGGGMSYVYKAKCNVLNRYVSIKILKEDFTSDSEFVEKFKQESLSVASLTHPNIVNIYDTGIEDNIYYIVMEYVNGETLKKYIQKNVRLTEAETLKISKQIAEALRHAHANNIVHRDIKPQNILLTEEGIVKVADFGIARAATNSTITNTTNVIGSVHYFSPEQARGGYVDEKSDIYSLGIVMYEMITGIVPFDADNHISVAMKQIQQVPIPPSEAVDDLAISKEFEAVIMKCLEKHQSFRFQNIEELINLLNKMTGYDVSTSGKKDIDSPTISMKKVNIKDDNFIEVEIIEDDSEKDFKTYFSGNEEVDKDDEDKEEDIIEKKKKRKITVAAVCSALVVSLIFGFIGYRATIYVPMIEVPEIVGLKEEEGRKKAEDLGFVFSVKNREYSKEYEKDEIIRQDLVEGQKFKKGYPIVVVVSEGKKEIKIPNLVGKYGIEVPVILKDAELKEGNVEKVYSDTIQEGKVVEQSPAADRPAEEGDVVNYKISKGPKVTYVVMPNVIGDFSDTARLKILQAGLREGQITEAYSNTIPAGCVMSQSIIAGHEVASGTYVALVVSIGKEPEKENTDEDNQDENIENNNEGEENTEGGSTSEQNQENNDKPLKESIYPLNIVLPNDKDKVLVVVQRIVNANPEVIYSQEVAASMGTLTINIRGTGKQVFEIYIDNTLYTKTEVSFD